MTLSEKIFGSTIGAFISYGKTATGALKALAVNDDGELKVNLEAATVNIGDIDINSPLGDSAKAASVSVTPATDIPATRLIGKVAIDQSTANANEVVIKSDSAGLATAGAAGAATDTPASVSVDEDGTARTHTSLLKAAKNLLIDISGYLSTLAGAVTSSKVQVDVKSTVSTAVTGPLTSTELISDIGALTDSPASVSVDEDGTSRSIISLLKGAKNLLIDISGFLSTLAGTVTSSKVQVDIKTITTGTTFIGQVGSQSFKVLQSFTRPADATAYTALDCIGPVTTPAIMTQDLASFGATVGRFLVITNARVISSIKGSGLTANIWIMPATFAATADNAELSIDDTTAALGGIVIPCLNNYTAALNARCVSDPGYWKMQLGAASTTLFWALQAATAYTPTSGEVFTVVMEGHLE